MFAHHRQPTEEELERCVLHASMLAWTAEQSRHQLQTTEEITSFLSQAFEELKVAPNEQQKRMAHVSVNALLAENDFIKDFTNFRLSYPDAQIPPEFRERMLKALETTIEEFMTKYRGDSDHSAPTDD